MNTDISNTLKLDPSAGTQYKIADNTSFGSVSVVNGENPEDAYSIALGSLTVDINSASGSARMRLAQIIGGCWRRLSTSKIQSKARKP